MNTTESTLAWPGRWSDWMKGKKPPAEIWRSFDGSWTWYCKRPVKPSKNRYAIVDAVVVTPYVPDGEYGSVYVSELLTCARKVAG